MSGSRSRISLIVAVLFVASIGIGVIVATSYKSPGGSYVKADRPKVALIVLDGGNWVVANQLLEKGKLPHFREYRKKGVYGELYQPTSFSPITWTRLSTGENVSNTNVHGWTARNEDRMVQSQDVKHKRLWGYLNDANISTGVVDWLVTWPARPINGFMISGPLATSDTGMVYPEGKFSDRKDIILNGREWKEGSLALNRTMGDYSFYALGFKNVDTYQHQLWRFIQPKAFGQERDPENDKYRQIIYTQYENLDDVMGRFDDSWNVIVMGDSGFAPEMSEYGYYAPTYEMDPTPVFAKLGYEKLDRMNVGGTEMSTPATGSHIERCSVKYPKNDVVNETTYLFRACIKNRTGFSIDEAVDRMNHLTYPDGERFLYDVKYVKSTDSIVGKMHFTQDQVVATKMEHGHVPQPHISGNTTYVNKAVDLELPNGTEFRYWIGPEKTGDHPPGVHGIFLAKGPMIADMGEALKNSIKTKDITPTVMYMYGLPIPREMDGRPMTFMLKDSYVNSHPVRYTNASTMKDSPYNSTFIRSKPSEGLMERILKRRLRDIGYNP